MSISTKKVISTLPKKRQQRIQKLAEAYITEYENLQELRKSIGLTQQEVAEAQGINQVNISNLEKRKDLQLSTLKKYVEALGCELEIYIRTPEKNLIRVKTL